jgi:phage terminase small subunit
LGGEALKYWRALGPSLLEAGSLTARSAPQFAMLCRLLAAAALAAAEIERDGVTIASRSGARKQHPAFGVLAQSAAAMRPLLARFDLDQNQL